MMVVERAKIGQDLDSTPEEETICSVSVDSEAFDQIAKTFPSLKMECDCGKIEILEVQGQGHQAVIAVASGQFRDLSRLPSMKNAFAVGGGLTPMCVCEDGLHRKLDKKADPDDALNVFLHQKFVFRSIFEVEIHSRNFFEIDQRMKSLLRGLPDCLIGVACKFFHEKKMAISKECC